MIFASLLATCALHWFYFRNRRLGEPVSVLFLIYLYYAYFVPVAMEMTGQYDIVINEQLVWVSDQDIRYGAVLAFLGYLGFCSVYRFLDRAVIRNAPEVGLRTAMELIHDRPSIRAYVVIVALYSIGIIGAFSVQLVALLGGYDAKVLVNYENASFGFAVTGFLLLASILVNYLILNARDYRKVAGISIAAFTFISFATYSKGPFIYVALSGLCAASRVKRLPQFPALLGFAAFAVLVLIYFVPIFSWYRAEGTLTFDAGSQSSLNSIYSDASGPYAIIIYAFRGYIPIAAHPLWESLVLWIPRFIWAGRPLDLPEDFARMVMVGWQPGFGMGFSPLAEAYARFGLYGSTLLMALFGAGIGLVQRLCARFAPDDVKPAIMMTVGGYMLLSSIRGSFSGVVTQGMQISVPLVLFALMASAWQRRTQTPAQYGGSVQSGSASTLA